MTPAPLPPLTPMARLRWPLVRAGVLGGSPEDVLEIGCGQGALGARLAREVDWTGIEPDLASFTVAQGRVGTTGHVLHGTDDDLPAGRTWAVVCAFEVLEHLEDDAAALARWFALTAPGGRVVLSVPAWQSRFGPSDELVGHYRRYDRGVLTERLTAAGFTDVDERLYGWPLGYALEAVRDRVSTRRLAAGAAQSEGTDQRGRASGRYLQPHRVLGAALAVAVRPFSAVQRLVPARGTGLVVTARRPAR